MRGFNFILIATGMMNLLTSCKKFTPEIKPAASLLVTTAIIGGGDVKFNSNLNDSAISFNSQIFSLKAGINNITVYPIKDPIKPYYSNTLEADPGSSYSLFLTGQISGVEAILVKETPPPFYIDSTLGIR